MLPRGYGGSLKCRDYIGTANGQVPFLLPKSYHLQSPASFLRNGPNGSPTTVSDVETTNHLTHQSTPFTSASRATPPKSSISTDSTTNPLWNEVFPKSRNRAKQNLRAISNPKIHLKPQHHPHHRPHNHLQIPPIRLLIILHNHINGQTE